MLGLSLGVFSGFLLVDDKYHFDNVEALSLVRVEEYNFGEFILYGKIQFVENYSDIKVKVVESFPALQ